ncbi:H-type lectin domain-containing protein [Rubripirellula sp.]|nr:hypothetical protein [Rubripirellula sp.]MDB4749673.1 H-type lectin domain-containing protein [Rubripirellula sp.]
MLRANPETDFEFNSSGKRNSSRRKRRRKNSGKRTGSRAAVTMVPRLESLEPRHLLSAILPAYVNDEFTFGDASSLAPYGLENTFSLQSRPTASKTIFLDFDGHHSVGNTWGHDIQFPAFNRDGNPNSFSDSELIEIQKQFQNVAEDFLPFDVNVTTLDPGLAALAKSSMNDSTWGIRAVNTQPTDGFGSGIGGIAYLKSFSYNQDTPVFTFNKGARNGGMTNSHEVGHALGLRHQGVNSQSYHPGTGTGQTSWGPILGAPFGKRLTQWSNSDYDGATIDQDDLTIITSNRNGFGYRDDDHGSSLQSATVITANESQLLSSWGIVERTEDQDWFSFQTGAGNVTLNIDAFGQDPNLDIEAKLHDASGNVIATSNPLNETNAAFDLELAAGQYFLSVDGVGLDGQNTDYGSIGFFSLQGTIVESTTEFVVGEAGEITDLNHEWQTVQLENQYENPAIVVGPLSFNGRHESTIRIRNVTPSSFDVRVQEWNYLDGWHTNETASYAVIESGVHTLSDGTVIAAGVSSTGTAWQPLGFGHEFDNTPVVFSQPLTEAESDAIVTRQRDVTSNGFSLRLQEEEALGPHINESVGWIAVGVTSSTAADSQLHTFVTENGVNHRRRQLQFPSIGTGSPIMMAAMQTSAGSDTANLRVTNLTADGAQVWVDEEKSRDRETRHAKEIVGGIVLSSGDLLATSSREGGDDDQPPSDDENAVGEAGWVSNLNHEWQTIQLEHTYENPAIAFGPLSFNGSHESTVRIRNVTATSFDVRIQEWNFLDGWHTTEEAGFMVIESGVHTLPDGTVIAAGVNENADSSWQDIQFAHNFDTTPVVISQATTMSELDAVVTRQQDITSTGFRMMLQEEEANGEHGVEHASWIAIATPQTTDSSEISAYTSDHSITHRRSTLSFNATADATPVVLAAMQSFAGSDTANLRFDNLGSDTVSVWVDEERSADRETRHAAEAVGVVTLSRGIIVAQDDSSGSNNGSGDGNAGNSASSDMPVPSVNFIPTDGTFGEATYLAPGHADDDCNDHDDHDGEGPAHDPGCSCGQCVGVDPTPFVDQPEHATHEDIAQMVPSFYDSRTSQALTSAIHSAARPSSDDMSAGEELTARPRISAFATTLQFSTDRHAYSHVTGNSNEAEIMKTQDNDSETNQAEKSSRVTSVLRNSNRMDSASNDNTKAIDSFFAESSADINFRNLA